MSETYFETLGATVYGALEAATESRAILKDALEAAIKMEAEPIPYHQSRAFSFELDFYKGKKTRKYFHVTISRLDSGRYELVTYVL